MRSSLGTSSAIKSLALGYTVFKARLKNSDIQKGKSGGYRVIYQLKDNTCVLLIVIYSKSDETDIPADRIRQIIDDFVL